MNYPERWKVSARRETNISSTGCHLLRDWLIPSVSFRAEEKGIGEIGGKIEGEGGDTREEANTSSLERQGLVTFLGLK